jgi:hypothetical protein
LTGRRHVKKTHRKFIVFTTLVCVLTLTSALLLALAPAPLAGDSATTSLFAISAPDSMDVIFQTKKSCEIGRWKYVFVHHSRTPAGNARTLDPEGKAADHFVIGNGDGAVDGEIQIGQRWDAQQSAVAPAGASSIEPTCISICLVGDFDRTRPTPTQIRRLTQLVTALQAKLQIPASDVSVVTQPKTGAAGIGRYFPAAAFREQLLSNND